MNPNCKKINFMLFILTILAIAGHEPEPDSQAIFFTAKPKPVLNSFFKFYF
jgi:hypothetical protein